MSPSVGFLSKKQVCVCVQLTFYIENNGEQEDLERLANNVKYSSFIWRLAKEDIQQEGGGYVLDEGRRREKPGLQSAFQDSWGYQKDPVSKNQKSKT